MVASMVIDARERVEDFVSRYGGPNGASLTEDIHVFYFAVDLEDSPVILLNRNGNHVRLVKDERGWSVYPMWSNLFDFDRSRAVVRNQPDLMSAIHKVSVGPWKQGAQEALCLFPKEAFASKRRRACFRWHEVDVRFQKGQRGEFNFSLTNPDGEMSPQYADKLWESEDAFLWCVENLDLQNPPGRLIGGTNPMQRDREMKEAVDGIEDNPLFGAWG